MMEALDGKDAEAASRLVTAAFRYILRLIVSSPKPNTSFLALSVLMSMAKMIGENEAGRQADDIDELESAVRRIQGAAGGKGSAVTRRGKQANWTIPALKLAKEYCDRRPDYTQRQLARHIEDRKVKGAPTERAIRTVIKSWIEIGEIPEPKKNWNRSGLVAQNIEKSGSEARFTV
jgi:hypothetical protein